jgi:hypothetical protein
MRRRAARLSRLNASLAWGLFLGHDCRLGMWFTLGSYALYPMRWCPHVLLAWLQMCLAVLFKQNLTYGTGEHYEWLHHQTQYLHANDASTACMHACNRPGYTDPSLRIWLMCGHRYLGVAAVDCSETVKRQAARRDPGREHRTYKCCCLLPVSVPARPACLPHRTALAVCARLPAPCCLPLLAHCSAEPTATIGRSRQHEARCGVLLSRESKVLSGLIMTLAAAT